MKRAIISLAALLLLGSTFSERIQLKFNENGKFKMIQFTDIHFGEDYDNDVHATNLMTQIIQQEQPDLVVVTGDMVSGYAWDGTEGWYALQYHNFTKAMRDTGVYWATTAGNHDTQADLTREEVSELDRSYDHSLTLPNAGNLTHAFNYFLPIYDETGVDEQFRLWFLDSGEEGCMGVAGYDCVRPDQIDWFRAEAKKNSSPSKGKGLLFVHIPFAEYMNLVNNDKFFGTRGEDICCFAVNTGLFSALKEQEIVQWVSVGHDHNNDYYGSYDGINLAYGRKTGVSCYGPSGFQRGARVFEVTKNPYNVETWIRNEDGTIDYQTDAGRLPIFSAGQTKCCGSLQKYQNIPDHDEEHQYLKQYYLKRADLMHLVQ